MRKIIVLFIILIPLFISAQKPGWSMGSESERAFVKNEGQYDGMNWQEVNKPEYVVKQANYFTFFTKKGITYRIESLIRNPNRDKNNPDSPKRVHTSELIDVFWIGANENVEIISENPTNYYYSYAIKDAKSGKVSNLNEVKGFKKITYKNLYDKIDVEYLIHPETGVKYNVILHPGADPSKIKFKYVTSHTNHAGENISISLNQSGQIEINASKGKIIEHKPVSFYNQSKLNIGSKYIFNNNILSFNLDNYDNTQKVIIDPWVVSPAFNAGDFTREVETDAAGNVYVIGGELPMELRKYNSIGVLQWTYTTPWDTNDGDWLGTLATDNLGTSFITQGTGAEIERVDNAGNMVWHANNTGFSVEYWSITFNCDNTKLIVGGTKSTVPTSFPLLFFATIYDIDISSGAVLSQAIVDTSSFGASDPATPVEVRSISSSKNAKYIYLTHKEVGAINQDIGACGSGSDPSYSASNTATLGYKCENFLSASQSGGGLKAIVANDNYFYTHKGNQVLQWDVNTGALINTVALPGGSSATSFGVLIVHCSGLAVDNAGNVYAGSMDRVVKFDQNLNILSQANTTGGFTVYDVSVNNNGEVIAVGAIQDNSVSTSRGGRIESLNMTAAAQYSSVCCDANFCPVEPLCTTDAPVNLSPNTAGGTWSSVPATAGLSSSTGVFNPTVAGAGSYVITYTLACGTNSTTINVGTCTALDICYNGSDLVVSNGTGGYTWSTCSSVNSGSCVSWTAVETGTNYTTSSTTDIILVEDGMGATDTLFTGITGVTACSATCDATITQAGPFCANATSVNLTAAETGGTWSGTGITNTTTGTFNPTTAGAGNHVITYNLPCGDTDTMTIAVNAGDDATFTYPSGSYCLSDPNPTPSAPITSGGIFTIDASGVINSSTGVINIGSSGIGNYIVTYITSGSCPDTATFNVAITNSTDATITQAGPFCLNAASVNLTAVSPGGTWTGTGITNGTTGAFNPATAGVGNHIITYTITGSCGDVDTMTIAVNAGDDANFTYPSGSYCLTDPNPTPSSPVTSGGIFTIDASGVINSSTGVINITSSGVGAFVVTYTTSGSCPDTSTFNVNINSCAAPQPVANFSTPQTNICVGDCISFSDLSNSSATGGITSWSWTFTGATPSTFNAQTPTNICYNTAGTYQVSLTVTDANGSDIETKTAYIIVTSCTVPTTNFSISDSTICSGSCINFIDMSTGATSWQWSFQNGTPPTSTLQHPSNICFDVAGTHEIKLVTSNAFGSDSLIKYVTVYQTQQVFIGNDTTIQLGQSVNLNATGLSSNGVYSWTPPIDLTCITCPNPTSTPEETITYTVITTDSNGCKSTDNINIIVLFENVIFVPNIFSPNGDGVNDILFVRGKGVEKLKFFVYDRWGEKVFETTSLDVGWDGSFRGKDMNKAVFVYYLEATFIDGQEVTQKGDITLVK